MKSQLLLANLYKQTKQTETVVARTPVESAHF
jgi:hypothetical protein